MKTIKFIIVFCLFMYSCKSSKKEAGVPRQKIQEQVSESFDEFNKRFHSDAAFQWSRISFPISGHRIDGFSKRVWSMENWELMKVPISTPMDTLQYKRSLNKTDTPVFEAVWIEQSGFRLERTFKLRNGKWFLTQYNDINL